MRYPLTQLLFILPLSLIAQSSWTAQVSGTAEYLNAIQFLDDQLGFCAGSNGTLLKTTNGGAQWNPLSVPQEDIRGVHFIDAEHGFIQTVHMVYKSENGQDFVPLQLFMDNIPESDTVTYVLRSTSMNFNGSIGIVSASYSDIPQTAPMIKKHWRTLDHGSTWNETSIPGYGFNFVEFLDEDHWFAAGQFLYETFDGGQNWDTSQTVLFSFPPITNDCFIITDASGSGMASMSYHLDYAAFSSFNGTMELNTDLHNVIDMEREGQVMRYLCWAVNGAVVKTSPDVGQTILTVVDTLIGAVDLEFDSPDLGWACGENGQIWRYGPDEVNAINEVTNDMGVVISPLPAIDHLDIRYLSSWRARTMEIVDLQGRIITSQPASACLDLGTIPSGRYILRLSDSEHTVQLNFIRIQ